MSSLPKNSCRASPSCLIFFWLVVTYGAFHMEVSALTLHLDLERWSRRKGKRRVKATWDRKESRQGGGKKGEYKEIRYGYHESFNDTRNSFASYFFSPSCTWTASSRWRYSHLKTLRLCHIFTSLGMSYV